MKLSRDLSGRDLVKAPCHDWNYRVVHQEGSHIVLETEDPSPQRIVVPAHHQLRVERSVRFCGLSRNTRAYTARKSSAGCGE